jgi:hypothetical protein
MMATALCLRCGHNKPAPRKKCKRCGFDPTIGNDDALVRSVYLSVGRFTEAAETERYAVELDQIRADIEGGKQPTFDNTELARLRAQMSAFKEVPLSAVWGALLRLFLPAVGLILGLLVLAYLIRTFK